MLFTKSVQNYKKNFDFPNSFRFSILLLNYIFILTTFVCNLIISFFFRIFVRFY